MNKPVAGSSDWRTLQAESKKDWKDRKSKTETEAEVSISGNKF